MEKIKMTEYKFKLVTKSESYNNEVRKKTNIIKILPLDYGEEANALHSKIAGLID